MGSHNMNCNLVFWPYKMCAHGSTPILKSHVTDCYVAVVVTTTNTYKYLPANQGIMFKKRRTKHPMTTQSVGMREILRMLLQLLLIYCYLYNVVRLVVPVRHHWRHTTIIHSHNQQMKKSTQHMC